MVFDLDPGQDVAWENVVEAARSVRDVLHRLELDSLVKTSGGKGLHVVAPLTGKDDWNAVSSFARAVAVRLAEEDDRFVATSAKRARTGRIFVDHLRNGRGSKAVAGWSPRARVGLPVSMPVAWGALGRPHAADAFRVIDLSPVGDARIRGGSGARSSNRCHVQGVRESANARAPLYKFQHVARACARSTRAARACRRHSSSLAGGRSDPRPPRTGES